MKFSVSVHVLIGFLLGASTSHGQTIVQHLGANDPLDAGFVLNPIISDLPGYAELEPVFYDFGFDAWSIKAIRNSVGFYT